MRTCILLIMLASAGCQSTSTVERGDATVWTPSRLDEYLHTLPDGATKPPIEREVAYKVLLLTEEFSGTAVGYAGTPSLQSYCCNALLYEPDAKQLFASLVEKAPPAGQLYGMCGLYSSDQAQFRKLAPQYRSNETEVLAFLGGCVGMPVTVKHVFADIENGKWPRRFAHVYDDDETEGLFGRESDEPGQ